MYRYPLSTVYELSTVEDAIVKYEIDRAKREKKIFDMEAIKDRLNTIIDLKGYKVSEEMMDMFVERIIYRGVIRGNDEFLWVMNLSGEATDTSYNQNSDSAVEGY